MIQPPKLILAAALVLSAIAAETPKAEAPRPLTDPQKLEWERTIRKAVMAENATHRLKAEYEAALAKLQAEAQAANQAAQSTQAKLLKEAGAGVGCTLTIDGEVKCDPPKPEVKK